MTRTHIPALIILIGAGFLHLGSAAAGTINVPGDYATIQAAVDAAADGDTILVAAGTYAENVTLSATSLVIVSQSGSGVTLAEPLDPELPAFWITGTAFDTVVLSGFTVTGMDSDTLSAIRCEGAHLVLSGDLLIDNRTSAVYVTDGGSIVADSNSFLHNRATKDASGIFCNSFTTANITRSIFHDNTGGDPFGNGGAAIVLRNGDSCTVYECLLDTNVSGGSGAAVYVRGVSIAMLYGNTANANYGTPGAAFGVYEVDTLYCFNNIISNSGWVSTQFVMDVGDFVLIDYNDAWNNKYGNYSGTHFSVGPHSLTVDPQFLGPLPVIYDLMATSPCIDAGNPDPEYNDPDASRSDIGAHRVSFDFDMDGFADEIDNCALIPNADQLDMDLDGVGDVCDNCPSVANPDQADSTNDGIGDLCDPDFDHDGIDDIFDNCPATPNPLQEDFDADGVGDACDNCVGVANPDQADSNFNGLGDACDACDRDYDTDGICDGLDNCGYVFNPDQADSNGDGTGDACDGCDCPYQGDWNADGYIDALDRYGAWIPVLGNFDANPQDADCPTFRGDYNADGVIDVVDATLNIEYLFNEGPAPVDPCTCGFPCASAVGTGSGSVFVESKTVITGQAFTAGVFVSNTTTLHSFVIPLIVRAIDTYPTTISLAIRADGRLGLNYGVPSSHVFLSAFSTMDGGCAGGPGTGFGGPVTGGGDPDVSGYFESISLDPAMLSSPDAFRYYAFRLLPSDPILPPGTDMSIPSLEFAFTAPPTPGMFEIDTTCTSPDVHLAFVEEVGFGEVIPSFTKGTITVNPCDCPHLSDFDESGFLDALDLNAMIDALFFSGANPQDPSCPTSRADFDYNGAPDAVDLNWLISHMFFGGEGPCDPCNPVQGTCVP